jgi:ABC-type lipoprotein export system ATPase subunit
MGALRDREQVTVAVVTHDEHVAAAADRIITMEDGRVTAARGEEAARTQRPA